MAATPVLISTLFLHTKQPNTKAALQNQQKVDEKLHFNNPSIQDHETIFSSFIVALIRESQAKNTNVNLLPEGSFLDSGCQFGEQAAHYAGTFYLVNNIAHTPYIYDLTKIIP